MAARDWKDLAANPETFGDAEKKLYSTLEPILHELLDELKANNRIETVYVSPELKALGVVIDTKNNCGINHNLLLHVSDNPEAFFNAVKPFGFDEKSTVQMYIEICAMLMILDTEMFRILVLFHTKGFDPKAAIRRLMEQLKAKDAAPKATVKLEPYLDLKFRNALAHGLFGFKGKQIVLYEDAKFGVLDVLDLADFMMRSKRQSVLTQCMINVIIEKKKIGFFS